MNPNADNLGSASRTQQCAEIVRKLSSSSRIGFRTVNGLCNLGLTILFGWEAWRGCVRLPNGDALALTLGGGVSLCATFVMLVATIQQAWLPPKDRLLLLLAEDYLARNQKEATPPAPVSRPEGQ